MDKFGVVVRTYNNYCITYGLYRHVPIVYHYLEFAYFIYKHSHHSCKLPEDIYSLNHRNAIETHYSLNHQNLLFSEPTKLTIL